MQTISLIARGLKLSHLRMIAALGEVGQMGEAALRLGISQPAASRLMSEVEQIVGRPVHRRTGRGAELTADGVALANRAKRCLLELSEAGRELAEFADGAVGHVRIGAVTGPALDRVMPVLHDLRNDTAQLTASVEIGSSDEICAALRNGDIDLALCRLPEVGESSDLDFSELGREAVDLVARATHPLIGRDFAAKNLVGFDWVLPPAPAILRSAVEARLTILGLPAPTGWLSTSSILLTLHHVQRSDAIAPMARSVAAVFTQAGHDYATLGDGFGLEMPPFGLVTRRNAALTPAAERIRARLMDDPDNL